jgi:hypothetical protein
MVPESRATRVEPRESSHTEVLFFRPQIPRLFWTQHQATYFHFRHCYSTSFLCRFESFSHHLGLDVLGSGIRSIEFGFRVSLGFRLGSRSDFCGFDAHGKLWLSIERLVMPTFAWPTAKSRLPNKVRDLGAACKNHVTTVTFFNTPTTLPCRHHQPGKDIRVFFRSSQVLSPANRK